MMMQLPDEADSVICLYPDRQCAFWDCRRAVLPDRLFCKTDHQLNALAESQRLRPNCLRNVYSSTEFERFLLVKLLKVLTRVEEPMNPGAANLSENLQILTTYPWMLPDVFTIEDMEDREPFRAWTFVSTFAVGHNAWELKHRRESNEPRTLLRPNHQDQALARPWKMYRFAIQNHPGSAIYYLLYTRPIVELVLPELEQPELEEAEQVE